MIFFTGEVEIFETRIEYKALVWVKGAARRDVDWISGIIQNAQIVFYEFCLPLIDLGKNGKFFLEQVD